jgi:hypothetical protein
MGPTMNPELFKAVTGDVTRRIDDEYVRRGTVAPVLADLSLEFSIKDNSPLPVTEPTLFARLFALSMVQRSNMGISDFNPLSAFDYNGKVLAKAAPHHDSYRDDSSIYHTRLIQFTLPDNSHEVSKDISIFGLNFYQPNLDDEPIEVSPEPTKTTSGLVITDRRGHVTQAKKTPVAGETVVFAVHNKATNDAKLYQVTIEPVEVTTAEMNYGQRQIDFKDENHAVVQLPDSRRVNVHQLSGSLQMEAVAELEAALATLKGLSSPDNILSAEEQRAAREAATGSNPYDV